MLYKLIGAKNYMETVGYLSNLYQSIFLEIKEPGIELIPPMVPSGGTVFDIGANIGRFTTLAARIVGKAGAVYSFEPQAYPLKVLRHMVKIKRLKHVKVMGIALSDSKGSSQLVIPLKDGWKPKAALAHLGDETNEASLTETIVMDTLDSFCEIQDIQRLDFIKCDVEGFEYNVFSGGKDTLSKFKPTVFCEIDKIFCQRNHIRPSEVFNLFKDLGYLCYLPDDKNQLSVFRDFDKIDNKAEFFFIHEDQIKHFADAITVS